VLKTLCVRPIIIWGREEGERKKEKREEEKKARMSATGNLHTLARNGINRKRSSPSGRNCFNATVKPPNTPTKPAKG